MRLVIQRVHYGKVIIEENIVASIKTGMVILVGFGRFDDQNFCNSNVWSVFLEKIATLRIFPNINGKMDSSVKDIDGELLLVPQFTLYGDCHRGRRPSFHDSAPGDIARVLFTQFFEELVLRLPGKVQKGVFGADMDICISNWGPVTILLDSDVYL